MLVPQNLEILEAPAKVMNLRMRYKTDKSKMFKSFYNAVNVREKKPVFDNSIQMFEESVYSR